MKINIQELFKKKEQLKVKEKNNIVLDSISNQSNTADIYKSRKAYKEQINDKNLPIGQVNKKGDNLNNQLDTWYKNKKYIKYDYENRLIVPQLDREVLKQFKNGFQLLNFVADAAENFFDQYNNKRRGHPKSNLNDIKIVKAYSPIELYQKHVDKIYVQFFNEVLNPIKNTNKIKDFNDFLNLFYAWFINQAIPITSTGYYESNSYNIYNTGMAFDFFNVDSEEDKATILNDVRFPVLNYVAKVNGLRIDPNNPGTLIADIQSEKLLELYASKYFKDQNISDLPKIILDKHFIKQNFFDSSETTISFLFSVLAGMYKRFINKYPSYIGYKASSEINQLFKKQFQTLKIERNEAEIFIDKHKVQYYINIRAKEKNISLEPTTVKTLSNNILPLLKIQDSIAFKESTSFIERLAASGQAINYLELFLKSKQSVSNGNKSSLVFFWNRAVRKLLTGTEEYANLGQQDEEGNGFSVSPIDPSTDFSQG
tara:strand:+ start:1511 stop:2962 length:1452 start_codon:yes stop_codon:yes gene_type:complete